MDAPRISRLTLALFRGIVRGYFRRHFHATRIQHAERFAALAASTEPLIVFGNHCSWWDPMVSFLLAEKLMPSRRHFAPMDATALDRYAILKRIGVFPVEMSSARGAAQFLRTSEAISQGGGVLWITPQGKFVDPRVRPLEFKPGLARLAGRLADNAGFCTVLPLAIEYCFWDERLPECLLHFGEPVRITPAETPSHIEERLIAGLGNAMDELKLAALQRNPGEFQELSRGTAGTGGFYALGQRLKAAILRRPYHPEHTVRRGTP